MPPRLQALATQLLLHELPKLRATARANLLMPSSKLPAPMSSKSCCSMPNHQEQRYVLLVLRDPQFIRPSTNAQTSKLNAGAAAKAAGIGASTAFAKIAAARKEIEGTETVGSPTAPRANATKKAPTPKKRPGKKRSAGEAMDDEDGADSGVSVASDNSPTKRPRKAANKVKKEIKEEEGVEDEAGVGYSITIKAVKQDKAEKVKGDGVEDEASLGNSTVVKAEEEVEERTTAIDNDGQSAGK